MQRSKKGKKEKKKHCISGGSNRGSLAYETDALSNLATRPIRGLDFGVGDSLNSFPDSDVRKN